ncbi:response regulator [Candidatus Electronema sp. PJ]|uniref:response regulator n=1 Tax=Candidatus Electronema sp. PJ TaxID=3401572 RepID=UPI003AA99997
MYDILIVDDDLFALALLEEQLKSYGDFFTPVYASNGREAIEILGQEDISLLVTDLIMPGEVSGWDMIDYIENFHPHIPVVVITGCTDKEKLEKLQKRVRHILLKPIKVRQLVKIVTNILNEDITSGSLKGISVGAFLQLLEIDGRTCLLEVGNSPKNKGLLYINRGKLYDAEYGDLREEEAAERIIALDNVRFQIKALPKVELRRRIKSDLMSIIMEAMKLKDDEASGRLEEGSKESSIEPSQDDIVVVNNIFDSANRQLPRESSQYIEKEGDKEECLPTVPQAKVALLPPQPAKPQPEQEKKMNITTLENMFNDLRCIKGYKTAALMNFSGEILIADSVETEADLENTGPLFNDLFRTAEEAAAKVGLEACIELVVKTPGGLVVMCCSGVSSSVHFHLIALLEKDGNQALTKMQMAKLVPIITKELE